MRAREMVQVYEPWEKKREFKRVEKDSSQAEPADFTPVLTVTRDGMITGDIWAAARAVERDRASLASRRAAESQAKDYIAAKKIEKRLKRLASREEKPEKLTKITKRKNFYEEWGETVKRLDKDGWKVKDMAACCSMSEQSVRNILIRLQEEGKKQC